MRARFPNVGGYSSHTKGLTRESSAPNYTGENSAPNYTGESSAPNYINRCSSADNPPISQCALDSASARVPYPRAALLRIPTQVPYKLELRKKYELLPTLNTGP